MGDENGTAWTVDEWAAHNLRKHQDAFGKVCAQLDIVTAERDAAVKRARKAEAAEYNLRTFQTAWWATGGHTDEAVVEEARLMLADARALHERAETAEAARDAAVDGEAVAGRLLKAADAALVAVRALAVDMWAECREGSPSCCEETTERWVLRLDAAIGGNDG